MRAHEPAAFQRREQAAVALLGEAAQLVENDVEGGVDFSNLAAPALLGSRPSLRGPALRSPSAHCAPGARAPMRLRAQGRRACGPQARGVVSEAVGAEFRDLLSVRRFAALGGARFALASDPLPCGAEARRRHRRRRRCAGGEECRRWRVGVPGCRGGRAGRLRRRRRACRPGGPGPSPAPRRAGAPRPGLPARGPGRGTCGAGAAPSEAAARARSSSSSSSPALHQSGVGRDAQHHQVAQGLQELAAQAPGVDARLRGAPAGLQRGAPRRPRRRPSAMASSMRRSIRSSRSATWASSTSPPPAAST